MATSPCLSETESYAVVKARHEQTCARLLSPRGYLEVIPALYDGSISIHFRRPFHLSKAKSMLHRHRHLCFYERRGGQLYRRQFIPRWLRDRAIRTLDAVVCDPRRDLPRTFNTFRGFRAAGLAPVDDALAWALVEPILAHIQEVLIPHNRAALGFVLDWLAHHLQRPAVRTRLGLVIIGGFGSGKDFLSTWHAEHIVGPLYSEVIFNPSEANRVADSVLVLSRLNGASAANISALKDLILRYDCRQRGREEENYSNVLVTTESTRLVRLVATHREFFTFRCSNLRQGDVAYFASLRDHLLRPQVIRAWYQTLMARDLSSYTDLNSFQHAADTLSPWRPSAQCDPRDPSSDSDA